MRKRGSYKAGLMYIALNDEPEWTDVEEISGMISVQLLAEVFGKSEQQVAEDVLRLREKAFKNKNMALVSD